MNPKKELLWSLRVRGPSGKSSLPVLMQPSAGGSGSVDPERRDPRSPGESRFGYGASGF